MVEYNHANPLFQEESAMQLRKMTELEQRMSEDFDWDGPGPGIEAAIAKWFG